MSDLEHLLGNPDDPDNPLGYAAFLDADERGELLPAGIALLEANGFGAEFVPQSLGGRLTQADELALALRPLFRRDAALGLGHGAINLIASVPVWTSGSAEQQKWLAEVLLRGGQSAGAYTELATGHDLVRSALRAESTGRGLVLNGRKEVINNISAAHAATVLARTSAEPGSRSHSLLLVDMAALPREHVRFLPRFRTSGMRAIRLGGVEFHDCPLPESTVLGNPGGALETVLRAFQVTKATLTNAVIGALDTQLRTVTRFALERKLYGRRVADLPHAKATLVNAYADLLVADCLSTVACRALHLLPRQTSVYTAAAKFLVPELTQDLLDGLSVVLGARSFLREGPYAIFQKHLRDLPLASLAHSGATVCQATIIPQLPRLARRWLDSAPAPDALFQLGGALPELDFTGLEILAGPEDPLLATLPALLSDVDKDLADFLLGQLHELRADCLALSPLNRTPLAEPVAFDVARRYALLLAAAACLGVHRHQSGDVDWLPAVLGRIATRLGHETEGGDGLFAELLARQHSGRAFDLTGRHLS
ncbi:acyl-CoA dehydrogenase [Lentzea kentuckyensis]|uniref:acyl-CoA dehydrogenase n=1 Tax=Lentzea kentuckyensis TaxID=360086 RepID=UPI000A37BF2E|nr:acyl-CoA dehydrogenase [Lentzea kentuckyensis]